MKKLAYCIIFLLPIIAQSANPPPPGLPDEPVAAPINSMISLLFIAAIVYAGYIILKKK